MFKFLNKLIANEDLYIGEHVIKKSKSNLDKVTYMCMINDYVICFEYYDSAELFNNLGSSSILYKNNVISKEHHNLTLSNFTDVFKSKKQNPNMSNNIHYIKRYFNDAISYVKKINAASLDIMLPFYQKELLKYIEILKVPANPTYEYPCGFVHKVEFKLNEMAPYNCEINRVNSPYLKQFFIVGYNNMLFDHISRHEYEDDNTTQNTYKRQQYKQFENIAHSIKTSLLSDAFSVQVYKNESSLTLSNPEHDQVLCYQIISSAKNQFGSHMDTYDEFYNNVELHLFWHVDFKNKTTVLTIYVYDDNKFIGEYKHDMNVNFNGELLNFDYYNNFFKQTIDKLIHCYFPNRKLVELLEDESVINDFDGKLTEEQYYLFKMINI